jgi:hypothetical protein
MERFDILMAISLVLVQPTNVKQAIFLKALNIDIVKEIVGGVRPTRHRTAPKKVVLIESFIELDNSIFVRIHDVL